MVNTPILKKQQIIKVLKAHPAWVSAFAAGEGCFTASVMFNIRAGWGFWAQADFNITQSLRDEDLLLAIKEFFENVGDVYNKKNGVGVYVVRKNIANTRIIIPYFDQHFPLGQKGVAYLLWKRALAIITSKSHIGTTLSARDNLVEFLTIVKELNLRDTRANKRKIQRNDIIVDWLKSLKAVPTLEQKLQMKQKLLKLKLGHDLY